MNEKARKKARRAELERALLNVWTDPINRGIDFADWLAGTSQAGFWRDEAKELIALYGEPIGERRGRCDGNHDR